MEYHVYGKAEVLDTPMGNIAKTMIKKGKMGISSRGLGTVDEDGNVNEDFNLLTWDLVTDPSNNPSWVKGIYEGCEFNIKGQEIDLETERKKEAEKEAQIKEALEYHKKKVWQVIKDIEKNL